MILKLENIVTKTSLGTVVLQLDKDEIISIQPKDTMKKGRLHTDAPLGWYGDGAFSNLFRLFTEIKTLNKTFTIEHLDEFQRNQCIDYIHMEMTIYVPPVQENKFYKKETKSALERAQKVVSAANYNDKLEKVTHRKKGYKELI